MAPSNQSGSTSPSIYAHFTSIRASDDCRSTFIPSTMLSFTSGELSSYAGLSRVNTTTVTDSTTKWYYTDEKVVTSVFNPGDLPCPPPGIAVRTGSYSYAFMILTALS